MNRDAAQTLLLCKWLRDRVKVWEAQAREELDAIPGQREPVILGGVPVGTVTQVQGQRTPKVVDEAAFLAWVKQTAPTEVETIEQVRPAYRQRILDQVKQIGALLDDDGTVIDGIVEMVVGEPHPMSKTNDETDIVIAGLLEKGRLGIGGLKQIEEQHD